MHQRHHIFNFHIGFWGALLISAVVTIQSGMLLLMTSSFTFAQTTPFVTLDQPSVDIQLLKDDALPLQAMTQSQAAGPLRFEITPQGGGLPDIIQVNSTTNVWSGVWADTENVGDYTIVAKIVDNAGTLHTSTSVNIEIIDNVEVDLSNPSDPNFLNDRTSANIDATTTSPVDTLEFTFTPVASGSSLVLQAGSTNNKNWTVTFNPSAMPVGDYNVTAEAFLGGSSAGQTLQPTQISIVDATVQETIDVTSPPTGQTLSGLTTLRAVSSSTATGVSFQVTSGGGAVLATEPGVSSDGVNWSAELDTTAIANTTTQPYALSVSGSIAGNIVPSPSISIFINNTPLASPPVISTTTLPNGIVGTSYSSSIVASSGTPPYAFAISTGALPTGLSISGTSGLISGTPTVAGTFAFTILVTDASLQTALANYTIEVSVPSSGAPLAIFSSNIADVAIGQSVIWTTQGAGGETPYTWSIVSGSLPVGMQLLQVAGDAVISGTPTTTGSVGFTLQVKDANNAVVQKSYQVNLTEAGTETGEPDEPAGSDILLSIKEPINTQTLSGKTVLVKVEANAQISAPKMSLVSSSGQNLLVNKPNTMAAPFGDTSGKNWLFTLDTTQFPNGSYTLRADTTTEGGLSAPGVSIKIANGEPVQSFAGNISSPQAGQTVAGNVPLIATVSGNPQSVMFVLTLPNGTQKRIIGIPNATGKFEGLWDSAGVAGGTVTIKAEVIDAQGVTKGLTAVTVNLREIKSTATQSTPDKVVDPKLVNNLQQGTISKLPVECQIADITSEAACNKHLEERRIKLLTEREEQILQEEQLPEVVTRHIDISQGKATQKQNGKVIQDPLSGIIPLDKSGEDNRSVLVLGSTEPPANLKPFVQQTVPALIIFDQDGDGLPDDMEARYGTNPNNVDTDGDGYTDAEEIKNGFNPNGPGKLTQELAPVERAILNNAPLDQPRFAGALSEEELQVQAISSDTEATDTSITFTGKAAANSVVTLYIYSQLPIVVTTKTDGAGNWSYEMQDTLVDGQHDVYVAVTNETGKIERKSRPLSFFVDSALAVSEEEFLAGTSITDNTNRFLLWYIIGGMMVITLGGFLFFFYLRTRVIIPE